MGNEPAVAQTLLALSLPPTESLLSPFRIDAEPGPVIP